MNHGIIVQILKKVTVLNLINSIFKYLDIRKKIIIKKL